MDSSQEEKEREFYEKFKGSLNTAYKFPTNYTFKFIVTSENKKIAELQQIFDDARPQIQTKSSRNGKYTSVTLTIYAVDADSVIHHYKEASKIEGVIML